MVLVDTTAAGAIFAYAIIYYFEVQYYKYTDDEDDDDNDNNDYERNRFTELVKCTIFCISSMTLCDFTIYFCRFLIPPTYA